MNTDIIPETPEPEPDGNKRHGPSGTRLPILTENEILARQCRLAVLVLAELVSTSKANTIRAIYSDVLSHHRSKRDRPVGRSMPPDLIEQIRKNPKLANLLADFVSEEDLDIIMTSLQEPSDE